jgi:hypothetical protein
VIQGLRQCTDKTGWDIDKPVNGRRKLTHLRVEHALK